MKSLTHLLNYITQECGDICSVDTTLDLKTIESRVENEGLSFLTITLTNYGKAFESALSSGCVTPTMFAGFSFHLGLPRLYGGFLELIFARDTGIIVDDPSIDAIRSVRQLTLMWGKILVDCSEDRVKSAFDRFIDCESELDKVEALVPAEKRAEFIRLSSLLFSRTFLHANSLVRDFGLSPKHGPGATADRIVANKKLEFPTWSHRLEAVCPYWRYATSRPYSQKLYDSVQFSEPGAEIPVRVIAVPKTLKTPRIIAIEPSHMQFMQQGILAAFTESIANDNLLRNMISTLDQTPNQDLAREGSREGNLATLDLSEASDRVSNWLAIDLLKMFPHLNDAVQASRSQFADVDGHGVVPLTKFASMGSALCFPMEIFVFTTLVFMGIQDAYDIRFRSTSQLEKYIGKVRVYGDDIIVPTDTTAHVMKNLELFGFKVNMNKSFWTGKFRESCGAEFYDGHDVSLTRVRRMLPASRENAQSVVSAVDLRNQLYTSGYWSTVRYMDKFLKGILPLPAVADTSSALGKISFLGFEDQRTCPKLQRPMVKAFVPKYDKRPSQISGDAALMKFFLKKGENPIFSKDHLEYAGRPIASSLNYRWTYSY